MEADESGGEEPGAVLRGTGGVTAVSCLGAGRDGSTGAGLVGRVGVCRGGSRRALGEPSGWLDIAGAGGTPRDAGALALTGDLGAGLGGWTGAGAESSSSSALAMPGSSSSSSSPATGLLGATGATGLGAGGAAVAGRGPGLPAGAADVAGESGSGLSGGGLTTGLESSAARRWRLASNSRAEGAGGPTMGIHAG